jgi:NADH dehydrogenase (ubiquinone) Fe-S protein 3
MSFNYEELQANVMQQVGAGVDRKPDTFKLPTPKPEKEEPKK